MRRVDIYAGYTAKKALYRIQGKSFNFLNLSKRLGSKVMMDPDSTNKYIGQLVSSGTPSFVGRYGGFELTAVINFLEGKLNSVAPIVSSLTTNAGFFNSTDENLKKFGEEYISATEQVDLVGRFWNGMEDYLIRAYCSPGVRICHMFYLEPWYPGVFEPWTYALAGKKVLVIHPFERSIITQYAKRDKIFKDPRILPEFDLKTVKAVQTIAGTQDNRFSTWFEALDYMYEKAMKIDFDIAIIGCGAYGFPLAAKLKQAGKVAIHLGGVTQILFGIKGRRWEEESRFDYIARHFNEDWIYPLDEDTVPNMSKVEGGCYWK